MIKITRESTPEELHVYWEECISHRMNTSDEVYRLTTCIKGFYHTHLEYEKQDQTEYKEYEDLVDFAKRAKRPLGNKNTTQSVIFNLGWDYQRAMCYSCEPEWVSVLADSLFELAVAKLEEDL